MHYNMDWKIFLSQAKSWKITAKTWSLKSCSDTCLMVLFHGVFQAQVTNPLPPPPPHLIPSRKLSYFHMTFFPSRCHPKCIPFSPKVSSTYDMFPKNHMKYLPHKLYKFPVQGYVVIISALCQTHIARISFFILLQLRCNSSINIWIVTFSLQLLQNS